MRDTGERNVRQDSLGDRPKSRRVEAYLSLSHGGGGHIAPAGDSDSITQHQYAQVTHFCGRCAEASRGVTFID
jgi:hypothetical protein